MSEEIDDLDAMITKAVLKAIVNKSEIEDTPEMMNSLNKAVEILKATGEQI
jgi:hypothetical protein